jgi:AraC family transcriptional regulator
LETYDSHGSEIPARDLPEHFITLQATGSALIEVEEGRTMRPYRIAAGGFCVSPSGPAARARWNEHRTLFVVALTPDWLATLTDRHRHEVVLQRAVGARDPQIEWLLRTLVHESKHNHPGGTAYLDALAHALALRALSLHTIEQFTSSHRGGLAGSRLRTVLDRMHADLAQPATTGELARLAGLSIDHFVRAFRVSIGEPPHRYLLRERIREAQRLLTTTSRPLAEIALQTGFADQSHFHSVFRRWVGTTPSRYRIER